MFVFLCVKHGKIPINKGLNALLRVWKTFEVRYYVVPKFGFWCSRVVFCLQRNQAAPQHSF